MALLGKAAMESYEAKQILMAVFVTDTNSYVHRLGDYNNAIHNRWTKGIANCH